MIEEFLRNIPLATEEIETTMDEEGTTWFSVKTSEPQFLLGRDGETLDAINHILKRMIENKTDFSKDENGKMNNVPFLFTIDINGFQKKKHENIKATAHMMAERARFFKSSIELDPMSSYERRIVHAFLTNAKDITTESVGVGRERRVKIKYITVELDSTI